MPDETPDTPAPSTPVQPVSAAAKIAADCQKIARLLGDRQNRDTTLTGAQATKIVNALLSAGNVLAGGAIAPVSLAERAAPHLAEIRASLAQFKLSTAAVDHLETLLK